MATWDSLVRFIASDGEEYWASLALEATPAAGLKVTGFSTIEDVESNLAGTEVTIDKVRSYHTPTNNDSSVQRGQTNHA
jgi:hypothetical protein